MNQGPLVEGFGCQAGKLTASKAQLSTIDVSVTKPSVVPQ